MCFSMLSDDSVDNDCIMEGDVTRRMKISVNKSPKEIFL